jgi:hypothetical protein
LHFPIPEGDFRQVIVDAWPHLSEAARDIVQAIVSGPDMPQAKLDLLKAVLARPALSQAQQRAILSILEI